MKLRSIMTSAFGVAVLSQLAAPASAVSLINEDFGTGLADSFNISTGTTIGAFDVSAGNIDLIGNNGGFDLYPGNGNYIDLNGNTTGAITSTGSFTFANGGILSFDYGTNGAPTSANVFLGTTLLGALTNPSGAAFSNQSYSIASGTTGALSFVSTNSGFGGIVLDNILLSSTDVPATAVPEPFTMIGTLIGGTAAIRLRKKLKVDSNV
ncbi:PEP-CTERM sorting domain-containing protein [Chamaesiphon sp.]|uniref:PEP-CTERM sorting domain-containing protein n=1 Tax=Chamaesiphon sp. TaxID=2814140 RepID=UPI003593CD51